MSKQTAENGATIPWIQTIDLKKVPWINDPSFKGLKKTFAEHFSLWFVGEEDPQQLEQHRRFQRSMGLCSDVDLHHQSVTVKSSSDEDGIWNAASFFETMPLEMFMLGPTGKGWNRWCKTRDTELRQDMYWQKWNHLSGLDGHAG